jgi:methionyl-tRNA formyltransferase
VRGPRSGLTTILALMSDLRVVFLGNDAWSATALASLAGAHQEAIRPVLVVTRSPRPARRGSTDQPTAVADLARRLELAVLEVETVRDGEGFKAIGAARADVVAVVAYGEILPRDVLDLPSLGCVNLHFSLLPRWRGASPVQQAILHGDAETGVSTMLMDEGMDTGPILEQIREPVTPRDDAGSLGEKLAGSGGILLGHSIAGLSAGTILPHAQAPEGAMHAPKLTPDDRVIDWGRGAEEIDRRVRAMSPRPGATTSFRGEVLKILRGEPFPGHASPGALLPIDPDVPAVDVGAEEGVFRLFEVAPAGRRRMPAADWARGARLQPGERLG